MAMTNGARMTCEEFCRELRAAAGRPGVLGLCIDGRLRWWLPAGILGGAESYADAVGVVWWGRTGRSSPGRLLDPLRYALALGLGDEEALALVDALDRPVEKLEGRARAWREALEAVALPAANSVV
jgi:hypothetical protein